MNHGAAVRPFSFRIMIVVLAVMILACADNPPEPSYTPQATSSISRSDGLAYGHFSSRVSAFIPDTADADIKIWVEGLPPGFTFNESTRTIEGDDPGAGVWNIRVCYTDRNKGVQGDPNRYFYNHFELRFFTSLEER
ncbi:MAG: hypothetical protein HPKKFMNG_00208 [Planctomycetes bacterium]|nr:hypothetical protein [Planctomycetota bacterium]GIK52000.1 MAG: hypothetical protein BroJett014_09730 [Planctomycetota bacterium]